jgi:hypothetical protein
MSDNYLKLIPASHTFVPSPTAMEETLRLVSSLCPHAQEIAKSGSETVLFYDCGSNLEAISCPHCGTSQMDWFFEEVARKYEESKLQDIQVQMPCCSKKSSLNDLHFDFPAGFASAGIEVLNPVRDWLTTAELDQVAASFGHSVKQIFAHY